MNKSERYAKLVIVSENETQGRDPRTISESELAELGFAAKPILQVIKERCMDCCGSDLSRPRNTMDEVKKCTAIDCPSWLYRMGKNPFAKKTLTEEQKQSARERFAKVRESKKILLDTIK